MVARPGDDLIAALDIGSAKICCFIAQDEGGGGKGDREGPLRVIGVGHQVSHGVRAGAVVDMDAAEASIRAAVHAAEDMAGTTVSGVAVNIGGGGPCSRRLPIELAIGGHEIGGADIRKVVDQGWAIDGDDDRAVIHALPTEYTIDGVTGISDPTGLSGETLGATLHVVSAARTTTRNLITCVSRCHLDVDLLVAASYASSIATLDDDEMNLGVACIDMGAGTTSVSVFRGGELIHVETVPVGGQHVTNDIAQGLSTPVAAAERLKTLYGSTLSAPSDERQQIDLPQVGENDPISRNQVPRSELIKIVRPRLEETFEMVRDRLAAAGIGASIFARVALTGGASQLSGVRDTAAQILGRRVRLAVPVGVKGLPDALSGPAFATCAGLLGYAATLDAKGPPRERRHPRSSSSRLGKIGHWFREYF